LIKQTSVDRKAAETDIKARYFLVGCVRSGTTLLTAILASHPCIASFPETMFFRYLFGNAGVRYYGKPLKGPKSVARWVLNEVRPKLGLAAPAGRARVSDFLREISREDLIGLFPPDGQSLDADIKGCLRILDALAAEQEKPIWIEKSPDHLAYIDEIARHVPNTKFVHLVRNGPDNIASIMDAARKYPDTHWNSNWGTLDRCITQWTHCIKISRRYASNPNHLIVNYDDLVTNTEAELMRVCAFLGVEYAPEMLTTYQSGAKDIVLKSSKWKQGVFESIKPNTSKIGMFNETEMNTIADGLKELSSDPIFGPLCVARSH